MMLEKVSKEDITKKDNSEQLDQVPTDEMPELVENVENELTDFQKNKESLIAKSDDHYI